MKQTTHSERPSFVRKSALISFLTLLAVFTIRGEARAQWTQPDAGGHINSTNTGNVGVGTPSPVNGKVEITADTGVADGEHSLLYASKSGTSSGGFRFGYRADGTNVTGGFLRSLNNLPLFVGTTGNPLALTVTNAGSFGFGTTSPWAKFVFSGNASAPPTPQDGTLFHLVNADGVKTRLNIDSFGIGAEPSVTFRFARGAAAAPSATQAGDIIGVVQGTGFGATSFLSAAKPALKMFATENWTDTSAGSAVTFWTTASGATTVAERMRIDHNGNVGLGITGPNQKLSVLGTGAFYNTTPVQPSGVRGLFMGNFSGGSSIWSYNYLSGVGDSLALSAQDLNLATYIGGNGVSRLFINNAGNVGVGTTNPGSQLFVGSGTPSVATLTGINVALGPGAGSYVSASNGTVNTFLGSDGSPYGIMGTLSNHPLGLRANNTLAVTVMPSGNVGIGTANPVQKLDVVGNVNGSGLCIAGDCKTAWSQVGGTASSQWASGANSSINYSAGNVGIGTGATAPSGRLTVIDGAHLAVYTTQGYGPTFSKDGLTVVANPDVGYSSMVIRSGHSSVPDRGLLRLSRYDGISPQQEMLYVRMDGNVGFGTITPGYRLDVQGGQVNASGGLCIAGDCKTAWSQVGSSQWASGAGSSISYGAGNVGIGTTAPRGALEVGGGPLFLGDMGNAQWGNLVVRGRVLSASNNIHLSPPGGTSVYIDSNYREAGGAAGPVNLNVSGDVIAGGNINAKYQDVAEWVPSTQKLAAGTVVVLDKSASNHVLASSRPYDTKVAGVVSEQPGVILGVGGDGKLKVATTGRVRIKVDASRGAIEVGDLLVTSEVEGMAMKSVPVDLGGTPIHRPGTIIGKALEPLERGTGEILVLLSLQ